MASLYFGAHGETLTRGSEGIGVFVDTEGVLANAFEGDITYDPHAARLVGVDDANSMITLWIEEPKDAVCDQSLCRVHFAGIIPGGFNVSDLYLFTLEIRPTADRLAVDADQVRVLASDGQGSDLPVTVRPLTVAVEPAPPTPIYADIRFYAILLLIIPAAFILWRFVFRARGQRGPTRGSSRRS